MSNITRITKIEFDAIFYFAFCCSHIFHLWYANDITEWSKFGWRVRERDDTQMNVHIRLEVRFALDVSIAISISIQKKKPDSIDKPMSPVCYVCLRICRWNWCCCFCCFFFFLLFCCASERKRERLRKIENRAASTFHSMYDTPFVCIRQIEINKFKFIIVFMFCEELKKSAYNDIGTEIATERKKTHSKCKVF